MCQIRSNGHHIIHQATNCIGIGNLLHVLHLNICLWTFIYRKLKVYESHSRLDFMFLWISIPKIFLARPKSFMSNSFLSFNSFTRKWLPTISISSKHIMAEKYKSHHQESSHKHKNHTRVTCSQSEACRNQTVCTTTMETTSIHTKTSSTRSTFSKPIWLLHVNLFF